MAQSSTSHSLSGITPQMENASIIPIATLINTNVDDKAFATDHLTSLVVPANATEYKTVRRPTSSGIAAKPVSVVYVKPPPKIAPKPPNHVRLNKSQTVFLQNTSAPLKGNIAYITMLKPVSNADISHQDSIQVSAAQKFVLNHPITKLAANRAPTNSVIPKFTLMPIAIQNNAQLQNKLINVTITDGQIQNYENNGPIRIIQTSEQTASLSQPSLMCDEVLTDHDNQVSYQLSISEDSNKPQAVSILKKSNQSSSINELNMSYKSFLKTITTISDATTKEVKISTEPNFTSMSIFKPPIDPQTSTAKPSDLSNLTLTSQFIADKSEKEAFANPIVQKIQKSERRRKSTVLIRKDFSENDDPMDDVDQPIKDPDGLSTEFADFKINTSEDYDIIKSLNWDDGVGSLPGTNLKFQLNEFGFLEYLTNAEYRKIYTKKLQKERLQQLTTSLQDGGEEMRCLECGCYGMPADFISPKYCSYDCQKAGDKKTSILRHLATSNFLTGVPQTISDVNMNNNINSANANNQNNGTSSNHYKNDVNCMKGKNQHDNLIQNSSLISASNIKIHGRRKRKVIYVGGGENQEVSKGEAGSVNGTDGSRSDDEGDNGKDSYQYPWACTKKGQKCFSWSKYLSHTNSKAGPVRLFKDPFPYQRNSFRLGMKLEGIDHQHPGTFCVLSVVEVRGYRIRVHLDGFSEQYDYWLNADSLDVFPAGYCEKHGYRLRPPPPYTEETFTWAAYLKDTKCTAAYKQIMANRPQFLPTNFRSGQKLEAVDIKNSNLVCVASVANIMDNRILVHFDSWDDIYDYWADPSSPHVHPVGWSDQNGHSLTPPNDYPDPETFSWNDYLRDTKSQAAPVRAFKQRHACGFRRTMKLECVDKRVPQLIRVATVDEVDDHKIKIRFDGWPAKYSYWVDDDSPDIHPVGWCSKTGHPIEPPLTPDDVYDFLECPTVGCRGVGNMLGPAHATHTNPIYCPYADEHLNMDWWRNLPDRLLSPNRRPERAVVVSRGPQAQLPKEPKRLGRPPKKPQSTSPSWLIPKPEPRSTIDTSDIRIKDEPLTTHISKKRRKEPTPNKQTNHRVDYTDVHNVLLQIERSPEQRKLFIRHTKKLDNLIQLRCRLNPSKWTFADVMNFVSGIPACSSKRQAFATHNIDGKCFLMLTQTDLMELLDFKLGPAVKLYNCIVLLRRRYPNCT